MASSYKRKVRIHIEPVQMTTFTALDWWAKLEPGEQAEVAKEGQAIAGELVQFGRSKLAIGEHLAKVQAVLEPKRLFGRFLKEFHFKSKTAYRYIAGWRNAQERLPEPVLRLAMAQGVNLIGDSEERPLGVYTEAVSQLPPPSGANTDEVRVWLTKIEQVRLEKKPVRSVKDIPQTPGVLLKEAYSVVADRFQQLPNNSRSRANWVRELVGMILSDLGVSAPQSFAPQAVPEDFRKTRRMVA